MISFALSLAIFQSNTLPPDLVETTEFLLARGMADSRGCELHWVTLGTREYPESTVAWVPASKEDRDGFGILNNGLKYPVTSIGEPATFAEIMKWSDDPRNSGRDPKGIAPIRSTAIFKALAVRAGQVKLAEEIERQYPSSGQVRTTLVNNFIYSLKTRAHYMFSMGEFEEAKGLSDHFVNNLNAFQTWSRFDLKPYERQISVREQFAALIDVNRDAKRRLREGPTKPFDLQANRRLPEKDQIANLIEALQDADGVAHYMEHPFIDELASFGDLAVPSLLEVCSSDTRLTRRILPHRGAFSPDKMVPTWHLAAASLQKIWVDGPAVFSLEQPEAAETLRSHWERSRSTTRKIG